MEEVGWDIIWNNVVLHVSVHTHYVYTHWVKLNEKKLGEMLKSAMKFLYAGENERPVRAMNFRSREKGGLGLIEPSVKASALLIRSMIKQYRNSLGNVSKLYGNEKKMTEIGNKMGVNVIKYKDIYNEMIK